MQLGKGKRVKTTIKSRAQSIASCAFFLIPFAFLCVLCVSVVKTI